MATSNEPSQLTIISKGKRLCVLFLSGLALPLLLLSKFLISEWQFSARGFIYKSDWQNPGCCPNLVTKTPLQDIIDYHWSISKRASQMLYTTQSKTTYLSNKTYLIRLLYSFPIYTFIAPARMKKQGKYWISLQKFPYRIPLQRSLTEREKTRAVSMLLSVSYKSFLQAYYLQKKKKKKSQ